MTTSRLRRRAAVAALGLCLVIAACGSDDDPDPASGAPTTAVERPSQTVDELVTIDSGRLHVRCSGEGDTTVLLVAGWDEGADGWAAVEPSVAEQTRTCAYDRFGTGTSDPPATPQTFETQVADLHELLDQIGEPGPYVVVGHSFGGAEAVTFAAAYADEVVGVMLVDASPVTWPDTVCSVPAYASGCALMRDPSSGERLDVFPAFEAVAKITSLGDLPMTVMTAAHRSPASLTPEELARLDGLWRAGTERWATLSTDSRIVTVEDTGHAIQAERPSVVLDEIVKLIRSGETRPARS